ncbi:MAG: hypothetical protein ACE5DW_01965 [Thermodesulfobacteriota bacterium]
MKKKNIIYIDGHTIQAVRARTDKDQFRVEETECFPLEDLEQYLRRNRDMDYILVVNFKRYYHETITVPSVSSRYMDKVISSEISRNSALADFSFIYTLEKEKTINDKKMREAHVFAVEMEELQGYIKRFTACGAALRAVYPDVYAAKFLIGRGASGLAIFNTMRAQKMFLLREEKVLFIRDVEVSGSDFFEIDARNIYLSISYCQQTLRLNPERLFLIGEVCSFTGAGALALPTASVLRPRGLEVSEEVFLKYLLPVSALYADKSIDISPPSFRASGRIKKTQTYGAAAFFALSLLGLIFLGITVKGAIASSLILTVQKNRLAHMAGLQYAYTQRLSKYGRYRAFLERLGKKPYSRLFYNLSALNLPGVSMEKLAASGEEDRVILTLDGLIEAPTLKETQARYDDLLEFFKGSAAMTVEEERLMFNEKSFTIKVSFL